MNVSKIVALTVVLAVAVESSDAASSVAGRVRDMSQTTSVAGMNLNVNFRNIQYSGSVRDIEVTDSGDGKYLVALKLHNASLAIGSTSIRGRMISADCGPLPITLGHREGVQINFVLKATGDDLNLLNTQFSLANGNWQIGSPRGVRTSGFGATQARVVSGLRSGLQQNRSTVEGLLRDEGPQILEQIKDDVVAKIASLNGPQEDIANTVADSADLNDDTMSAPTETAVTDTVAVAETASADAANENTVVAVSSSSEDGSRSNSNQAVEQAIPSELAVVGSAGANSNASQSTKPTVRNPLRSNNASSMAITKPAARASQSKSFASINRSSNAGMQLPVTRPLRMLSLIFIR